MRFIAGISTLGILLVLVSIVIMRGGLTAQAEMEPCYDYDSASYTECINRNEQRSEENVERINKDFRRGVLLFKVSAGLVVVGGAGLLIMRRVR